MEVPIGSDDEGRSRRLNTFLKIASSNILEILQNLATISGGLAIIVFGGMQLGWNFYYLHVFYRVAPLIWLLAATAGSVSTIFVDQPKRKIYIVGCILMMLASVPLMFTNIAFLLAISDVIGAFIYGFTYATVLSHTQKLTSAHIKGTVVTFIHLCLFIGVLLAQLLYDVNRHTAIRNFGAFSFILANAGILLTHFFLRESQSPSNEEFSMEAAPAMSTVTHQEGTSLTNNQQEFELKTIILAVLLKVTFCLTFNIVLNATSLFGSEVSFVNGDQIPIAEHNIACYSQLYGYRNGERFIGYRILGIVLAMLTVDLNKRVNLWFTLFSGVTLVLLSGFDFITYHYTKVIQCIFQLLSGFSVGFLADVFAVQNLENLFQKRVLGIALHNVLEFLLQSIFFFVFFSESVITKKEIAVFRLVTGICLVAVATIVAVMFKVESAVSSVQSRRNKSN